MKIIIWLWRDNIEIDKKTWGLTMSWPLNKRRLRLEITMGNAGKTYGLIFLFTRRDKTGQHNIVHNIDTIRAWITRISTWTCCDIVIGGDFNIFVKISHIIIDSIWVFKDIRTKGHAHKLYNFPVNTWLWSICRYTWTPIAQTIAIHLQFSTLLFLNT